MNDIKQPLKFSNMKPLEVIEPYNPQIVEFETVDDFNIYYNKHPDEFANKTTQKLNTKYKIPGYKLMISMCALFATLTILAIFMKFFTCFVYFGYYFCSF